MLVGLSLAAVLCEGNRALCLSSLISMHKHGAQGGPAVRVASFRAQLVFCGPIHSLYSACPKSHYISHTFNLPPNACALFAPALITHILPAPHLSNSVSQDPILQLSMRPAHHPPFACPADCTAGGDFPDTHSTARHFGRSAAGCCEGSGLR